MALSGLIGAGAQQGLEQLLARQLEEQAQADRVRLAEEEGRRREAALAEQARQFDLEQGLTREQAAQSADDRSATRRMQMNIEGLRQMDRDRDTLDREQAMAGQSAALEALPPEVAQRVRTIVAIGGRPTAADLVPEEQRAAQARAQEEADVRRAGRIADAQASAAARYREPKTETADRASVEDARIQRYTQEKLAEALSTVKQLKGLAGPASTGAMNITKYLPSTPARSLENVLNQLRGQLAFKELAAIRAASPTGGGLGSITERELELLASSQGGLDPMASNFASELDKIEQSLTRARGGIAPGASAGLHAEPMPGAAGPVQVTAPNGKTYTFPDEASAARFRAAIGGQ